MAQAPMLIAGGGIAGLAAAIGLARIGRPSVVFEQAPAIETAGAGLQLGPNAVRALRWLGVWEALASRSTAPAEIVIHDGLSGRVLHRVDLGRHFEQRFGEPYRVAHRADLIGALAGAARDCGLVDLRLGERFEPRREEAAGLIGADGIRSAVRQRLIAPLAPRSAGHGLYRALIPAGEAPHVVALWLLPGGHVVHYPVSGGRSLNIVATIASSRSCATWSEPADGQSLLGRFARCSPRLLELLSRPRGWTRWAAEDLEDFGAWNRGRTVLIGDAAHAALPYLAQGAAMALEDAVVLSRRLEAGAEIAEVFAAFVRERRARAGRVAAASRRVGVVYHLETPLRQARNALLRALTREAFLARMAWLYAYDPRRG